MGLESLYEWFQSEMKYVLFIVALGLMAYFAFKRAWIAMAGSIIGLALIAIFITTPDTLIDIGQWFSDKLSLDNPNSGSGG